MIEFFLINSLNTTENLTHLNAIRRHWGDDFYVYDMWVQWHWGDELNFQWHWGNFFPFQYLFKKLANNKIWGAVGDALSLFLNPPLTCMKGTGFEKILCLRCGLDSEGHGWRKRWSTPAVPNLITSRCFLLPTTLLTNTFTCFYYC